MTLRSFTGLGGSIFGSGFIRLFAFGFVELIRNANAGSLVGLCRSAVVLSVWEDMCGMQAHRPYNC